MAATLISQIVWSGMRPLREALSGEQSRTPREMMLETLAGCSLVASSLDEMQVQVDKALSNGGEGQKIALTIKECQNAVEEGLGLFAKARQTVTEARSPFPEAGEWLSTLNGLTSRAEGVRDRFASLLRWLEVPPPRVDPASVAKGGDSPTAEGYVDSAGVQEILRKAGKI